MNLRMTPQRRVLLELLRDVRWHPTADDLFQAVRRRLPRISLGTVYRNLEALSKVGMIRGLQVAGGPKRYDGRSGEHLHARCLRCGALEDLEPGARPELDQVLGLVGLETRNDAGAERNSTSEAAEPVRGGFRITGHVLEFVGICHRCRPVGDVR